jgi:hypothetical protein
VYFTLTFGDPVDFYSRVLGGGDASDRVLAAAATGLQDEL